jgi:hypothetical protein
MSRKQAVKTNVLGNSMAKWAKIYLRTNTSLRVTDLTGSLLGTV